MKILAQTTASEVNQAQDIPPWCMFIRIQQVDLELPESHQRLLHRLHCRLRQFHIVPPQDDLEHCAWYRAIDWLPPVGTKID